MLTLIAMRVNIACFHLVRRQITYRSVRALVVVKAVNIGNDRNLQLRKIGIDSAVGFLFF